MSFTRWMFAVLVALFFMIQLAAACGMSAMVVFTPVDFVLMMVCIPFYPVIVVAHYVSYYIKQGSNSARTDAPSGFAPQRQVLSKTPKRAAPQLRSAHAADAARAQRLAHHRARTSALHARANTPELDKSAVFKYAMELVMLGDFHAAYPYLTELLYPTRPLASVAPHLEIRHQVAARYLRMMTNRSLQDPVEAALDAKAALDLLAKAGTKAPVVHAASTDLLGGSAPRKEIRITPRTLTVAYCNLLLDQVLHGPRSSEYPTSDASSRSASEPVSARELLAEAARMLDDLGPILPTDTLDDRTELRLARCAVTFYRCFYEPSLGPNATDGGAARTAALEEVLCIAAEVIVDLDSAKVSEGQTVAEVFNRLQLAQYRSQALGVRARSLALLRRYDEAEAAQRANLAIRLMGFDGKIHPLSEPVRINLRDDMQLAVPLRPPRDIPGLRKSPHEFETVRLLSPTWCETCTGFIVSLRAARCTKCNWTVHTECQSKAEKAKCWAAPKATNTTPSGIECIHDDGHSKTCEECQKLREIAFAVNGGPVKQISLYHGWDANRQARLDANHRHTLKHVWFHKPTWCSRCDEFVYSPVGKQGYSCTTCQFTVHNKCAHKRDIFLPE